MSNATTIGMQRCDRLQQEHDGDNGQYPDGRSMSPVALFGLPLPDNGIDSMEPAWSPGAALGQLWHACSG